MPNGIDRQQEDGKVRDDVNGRAGDYRSIGANTCSWDRRIPDLFPGHTREYEGDEEGKVEDEIGPDEG